MIPGVVGLRWKSRTHGFRPSIENSDLSKANIMTKSRLDYLVANAVRVKNRPEWVFIKLHTHGAIEENWDANFGLAARKMYEYLESKFNDEKNYVLHFVTAREMYNIVKAVEAGKTGDPGQHRDFLVKKYSLRII